jgi:hypothetical protein
MTKGAFSRKAPHATEWRLTWWSCDVTAELASKKFMSWGRGKKRGIKISRHSKKVTVPSFDAV